MINKNKKSKCDKNGLNYYQIADRHNVLTDLNIAPILTIYDESLISKAYDVQAFNLGFCNHQRNKYLGYANRFELWNNMNIDLINYNEKEYYLFDNGNIPYMCKMKGFISDFAFDEKENKLKAILICFPFVFCSKKKMDKMIEQNILNKNQVFKDGYYLRDTHIWLHIDSIRSYEDKNFNKRNIKLALGSEIEFVASIDKYIGKTGKERNGIKYWSPLKTYLNVSLSKKKFKIINIPNVFISKGILLKYSQDVLNSIEVETNNKEKIENDEKFIKCLKAYDIIVTSDEIRYNNDKSRVIVKKYLS